MTDNEIRIQQLERLVEDNTALIQHTQDEEFKRTLESQVRDIEKEIRTLRGAKIIKLKNNRLL